MVTVEFDSMGEAVRLALVAGEYVGGGLAVLLPRRHGPRAPTATWPEWACSMANGRRRSGGAAGAATSLSTPRSPRHFSALVVAGILRMAGRSAASRMARYPLATVAGRALAGMGGLSETLRGGARLDGRRRVRVGRRRRGVRGGERRRDRPSSSASSPPRGPRPTRWRPPADGCRPGWVRGCETIDCETGRTVYAVGAE